MATEACVSEPWNYRFIRAPPCCTVPTLVRESDMNNMKNILFDGITTLNKNLKIFNFEAALLSRFLYKFKRLFRQDKGIQQLSKVNQALKRYWAYRPSDAMKLLKKCIPAKIPPDGTEAHLPTQQLLKWVLLRLLANAKLFVRIIELGKEAGRFIFGRLCIGWSSRYMLLAMAINSRIWTCAKYTLMNIIEWYDQLRNYLPLLIETVEFVPGFEFPRKMEDFIGYVDLKPPTKKADIDKIFELIDLTRGDESDDDIILMNEIIRTVDSDSEIEITSEDVIVEEESFRKKAKKRPRDDDVAVLYEKTKRPAPNLAPLKTVHHIEDLGEPVYQTKNSKKRKRFEGRRQRGRRQ